MDKQKNMPKETKKSQKNIKKQNKWEKKEEKYMRKEEKKRNRPAIIRYVCLFFSGVKKLSLTLVKVASIALIILIIVGSIIWTVVHPIVKEVRETEYEKLINCNAQTFQLKANTIIYDKKGKEIGKLNAGNYIDCKIEDVSKYLKDGYIAVEDKNYKVHNGVDFKAVARAGLALVKNKGEITQGASTITQQVVKNNLLTNERTYFRKATEILLAMDIEKEYNKAQILEFYLNTNFYGHNCYGIGAACYYYFDCTPKDVSPAQAAVLMGISNAPTAYDPVNNYNNAMKNKNFILKVMYDEGVITEKQYSKALKEKIRIKQKEFKDETSTSYQVTYALHCATLDLMEKDGFKFQYIFKDEKKQKAYEKKYSKAYEKKYQDIRSGGYKIYTSLDSKIQRRLQKTVDEQLKDYTEKSDDVYKMQGAAVCIDNNTNYVVAVVGGRSGSGEYNRAYQSARQPGSSIKPVVVYGPAFDTGLYYPSSKINNTAISGTYAPKNWDGVYTSSQSIREAISHSTNAVAYRTLQNVGIGEGLNYLSSMKFSHLSYADNNNYAIALGGFTNGVSPLEMAKAYNALANGGKYSERTCIVSIVSADGEIYDTNTEITKQVYSEDTAYMITSCLRGVVENGTGTAAKVNGQIVVGKTGTTNSNKDAWFCGYSKYYTTTVWTGYDNPQTLYDTSKANKIFSSFMAVISKEKKQTEFSRPNSIVLKYIDSSGKPIHSKTVNDNYYKEGVKISYYSMDYFSTKEAKGLSKERLNEIESDSLEKAKKAVEKFETYTIADIESASTMPEIYKSTKQKVYKVNDEYMRSELLKRVEKRYNILSEIYNKWIEAINEKESQNYQNSISEQEIKDSDSLDDAALELKNNRVANVEFYLNKLSERTYYDNGTIKTINLLNEALGKLSIYDIYDEYSNSVSDAITKAQNLPQRENLPYEDKTEEETTVTNKSYKKMINGE